LAEQRSRGPAEDALATMNDHLARFFQHADVLLREWKVYGDELRTSLDTQVRELQGTVAGAVTEAGRAAADKLDGQVDRAVAQSVNRSVERSLGESMEGLRRELDELARLAAQSSARIEGGERPARAGTGARPGTQAPKRSMAQSGIFLLALTTANVMLAVLLIMNVHHCTGSDRPRASSGQPGVAGVNDVSGLIPGGVDAGRADAAPADDAGAGEQEAMCATLAKAYDPDVARAFLAASAQELCGDEAASQVVKTLEPHLADEAPDQDKGAKGSGKKRKSPGDGK
jgi:hypothetical protein